MELKKGEKINLEGGKTAQIEKELGRGGQGIVYAVTIDSKHYALKWYTCKFASKKKFRENLKNNIKSGVPDEKFLWPLFLTEERGDTFGYVMELREQRFSDFSDILNNKVKFDSTQICIEAALNLVNAFRSLHSRGLSYQDLNDGGFFIDVKNGDVLICDNDNVTPDEQKNPGNVGGKPGYMAPEVFRGSRHPNSLTDCHSLAVILFKLFCRHDPLMGKLYVAKPCVTEEYEMELYGKNPVFIFDPNDTSNRPVHGVYTNPIKLWPRLPKYMQDAFIKSFCEGMKDPNRRLAESEWQKYLIRFRDEILCCPLCGEKFEQIFSSSNVGEAIKFSCGHSYSYPRTLNTGRFKVPLFPGKKLYKCHTTTDSNDDYKTQTAEIIMNKKNQSLWGIKNLSQDIWSFSTETGEHKTIANGSVIPIATGLEISMGNNLKIKIEK